MVTKKALNNIIITVPLGPCMISESNGFEIILHIANNKIKRLVLKSSVTHSRFWLRFVPM